MSILLRGRLLSVEVALVGTLLLAVAPLVGVTHPRADPDALVWAFAAAVAVAVPVLAALAVRAGRDAVGAGLLAGFGAVAAGRVPADVALLAHPIDANRFELLRPRSATELTASAGGWLVLLGHLCVVAAGVLAVRRLPDDTDLPDRPIGSRAGGVAVLALVAAALLVGGLFPAAWGSTDPVIVVESALDDGRRLAVAASLAAAVLAAVGAALAARRVSVAASTLVGVGIGVGGPAGAGWLAAVDPRLTATWATWVVATGAVGLIGTGCAVPAIVARPDRERRRPRTAMPSVQRRHVLAGIVVAAAALIVAAGCLLPVLGVPAGVAQPPVPATRTTLLAAVVLLGACVWLPLSAYAGLVRPALGPLIAALVAAGSGVLQAVATGMRAPGVGFGPGAVLVAAGIAVAVVGGVLVASAGAAERDDVDRSDPPPLDRALLVVGGAGALAAVVAYALPVHLGEPPAGSFALPWGWDSWAQAVAAIIVVVAVSVAARSRPARAVALLIGCVLAMVVHLAGWPLSGLRVGPGAVAGAVAATLLASSSVLAFRRIS